MFLGGKVKTPELWKKDFVIFLDKLSREKNRKHEKEKKTQKRRFAKALELLV